MTDVPAATAPSRLRQLAEFATATEPRKPLARRSAVFDVLLAFVFLLASLVAATYSYHAGIAAAVLTTVPLTVRRRYPLAVFLVIVIAALVTKAHATDVTFVAMIFAGYSAAVHSRYRGAALLTLAPVGLVVAAIFWSARPAFDDVSTTVSTPGGTFVVPLKVAGPLPGIDSVAAGGPLRIAGLLVLVSLVSVAVVGAMIYAGDRIRRLQAEHEEVTRRAIERERARIASELHDVVTHNVSVMIVQAGAARQVLTDSPGKARTALLAVEASGRAAMTELRHLLGLLSPAAAGGPGGTGSGAVSGNGLAGTGAPPGATGVLFAEDLQPQPGLDQLRPLIDRVTAVGLPVELQVTGRSCELSPGLDLAAYRIIQEALTNVLKHAGSSPTSIRLDYRDGSLLVDVADVGRRDPLAASAMPVPFGTVLSSTVPSSTVLSSRVLSSTVPSGTVPPGTGRGLLGLRERAALYNGQLDAGPRPGGGWRVRARFPLDRPPVLRRDPSADPAADPADPADTADPVSAAHPADLAPVAADPQ